MDWRMEWVAKKVENKAAQLGRRYSWTFFPQKLYSLGVFLGGQTMKYVGEEADRVMMRACSVQVSRDQSLGEWGIPKMITFNHKGGRGEEAREGQKIIWWNILWLIGGEGKGGVSKKITFDHMWEGGSEEGMNLITWYFSPHGGEKPFGFLLGI